MTDEINNWTNEIHQGDARDILKHIPDDSIDLVVTSPPYNVGVEYEEYDDDITVSDYRCMIEEMFFCLNRILKETGRVCVNVGLKNNNGIYDIPSVIKEEAGLVDWDLRFEIIWNKGSSESSSSWGSWRSPSSPRPIFNHEYILVFDVGDEKRNSRQTMEKKQFMQLVKSVWNINPETSSRHPAPYPVEIPERLIKLNSYEGDIVLDPFMGSGTTAIAAEHLDRNWIGVELSKKYINMSYDRIESETKRIFDDRSIFNY